MRVSIMRTAALVLAIIAYAEKGKKLPEPTCEACGVAEPMLLGGTWLCPKHEHLWSLV